MAFKEGQIATNPKTGQKITFKNGSWTKPNKTAANPKTGERIELVEGQWKPIKTTATKKQTNKEQTLGEDAAELAAEITSSIAGQGVSTPLLALGPILGPIAYGVSSFGIGFSGSITAQKNIGSSDVSWTRAFVNGAISMLPGAPALRSVHSTSKIGSKVIGEVAKVEAKRGAAIGGVSVVGNAVEEQRIPTLSEVAIGVGVGAGLGGGFGSILPKISKTFQKFLGKTAPQIEKGLVDGTITKQDAINVATFGNGINKPMSVKDATRLVDATIESISKKGIKKSIYADDVSLTTKGVVKSVAAKFTNAKANFVPSRILGREANNEIYSATKKIEGVLDVGEKIGNSINAYLAKHPAHTNSVRQAMDGGKFNNDIRGTAIEGDIIAYRQQVKELQTIAARQLGEEDFVNMSSKQQGDLLNMLDNSINSNTKWNTTEYQMFTNSKFTPNPEQLPLARKEVALRILKQDPTKSKKQAAQEAKEHLEELTTQSAKNLQASNKPTTNPTGIFRRKGDIGPEQARYMGVITDPGEKVKGSITKLGRYVLSNEADVTIAKQIVKTGMGAIDPINKKGLVPLQLKGNIQNNIWVKPEYNLALSKSYLNVSDAVSSNPTAAMIFDGVTSAVALSKAVKVIFNAPSHFVNFFGSTAQMIGMGMNPISSAGFKGLKASVGEFRWIEKLLSGKTAKSRQAYLKQEKKYKSLGLMNKNVIMSDIRDGFSQNQGKVSSTLNKAVEPWGKLYSVSDTTARIAVFEKTAERFAKLFPKELNKVEGAAAKLTNDVYQNYERIPSWIRTLSKFGAMPQFVAFTAEFTRNMSNQARVAGQMLRGTFGKEYGFDVSKANIKAMRIEGGKRAAGLLILSGGSILAVRGMNDSVGMTSEKEDAMRTFQADYNKNKALVYTDISEDGKEGTFMDAQYLIPHVGLGSIVESVISGDSPKVIFGKTLKAFIGEGTFVAVNVINGVQNRDENGNQISGDPSALNNFADRFSYAFDETFTPGQFREFEKYFETKESIAQGKEPKNTYEDIIKRQFGIRKTKFKISDMAMFKTRNFNKASLEAGKEYRSARDYKDTSKENLDKLYNEADRVRRANMDELSKINRDLTTLEFNEGERIQILKDGGLSSKDVLSILDGFYIPLDREKSTSTSEIFEDKYANMPVKQFKKELNLIAKDDIRLAIRLRDEYKRRLKDNYRGLTSTDKLFSSMAVEDRVNYIIKNPSLYKEYKKKGLINKSIYIELRRKGYQF